MCHARRAVETLIVSPFVSVASVPVHTLAGAPYQVIHTEGINANETDTNK